MLYQVIFIASAGGAIFPAKQTAWKNLEKMTNTL
jgi:hypothetical protein